MKIVNGQVTLATTMPFVFLKSPWYNDISLHLIVLISGAVLFLVFMVTWLARLLKKQKNDEKQPIMLRLARWNAVLFAMVFLFFTIRFSAIFSNINPAMGVPDIFFNSTASLVPLFLLPKIMLGSAILMVLFSVWVWWKSSWRVAGRIGYTVLSVFSVAICGMFMFWNLL
jgi:hypothetical protein